MSKYTLIGVDGNAYAIMGYTSTALKREGLGNLEDEMMEKATSGNYSHLIAVCAEYVQMANEKAVENGYEEDEE